MTTRTPPLRTPEQLQVELVRRALRDARQDADGCIEFGGGTDANGYGRFRFEGTLYAPHRVVLGLRRRRALAANEDVRQRCRRRNCVQPAHLYAELRGARYLGPRMRTKPLPALSLSELLEQLDALDFSLAWRAAVAAQPRLRTRRRNP